MFLYHQIGLSISFPTPYSKLFYYTKTREATTKTRHEVKNDGKGGEGHDKIFQSTLFSFITRKNQVLVLTFWIGKQNAEEHIEKGFFS